MLKQCLLLMTLLPLLLSCGGGGGSKSSSESRFSLKQSYRSTSYSTIGLSGDAPFYYVSGDRCPVGVSVSWVNSSNNTSGSGSSSAGCITYIVGEGIFSSWSVNSIPLKMGDNDITIKVSMGSKNKTLSITITRVCADQVSFISSSTSRGSVEVNTEYVLGGFVVGEICADLPISISAPSLGGEAYYSIDGGEWISTPSTISSGQEIRVRYSSAPTHSTSNLVFLDIGTPGCPPEHLCSSYRTRLSLSTRPGSALDAPVVVVSSPSSGSTFHLPVIEVTGTANDADGDEIRDIKVNGIVADTDDGYATWSVLIGLPSGESIITIESADVARNVNQSAARLSVSNTISPFNNIGAISFRDDLRLLYMVDVGRDILLAMNVDTHVWETVSESSPIDIPFVKPRKMYLMSDLSVAYVLDTSYDDLIVIDLLTGERSFLSGEGYLVRDIVSFAVDEDSEMAFLLSGDRCGVDSSNALLAGCVVTVDLTTGERVLLSNNEIPTAKPDFFAALEIVNDIDRDRLIVFMSYGFMSVDLRTGERVLIYEKDNYWPLAVLLDSWNDRVFIGNKRYGTFGLNSLGEYDLVTGEIVELGVGSEMGSLADFAYDPVTNTLYFTDDTGVGAVYLDLPVLIKDYY